MFDILLIYFLDLVEAAFKKCKRQFISEETKSVLLIAERSSYLVCTYNRKTIDCDKSFIRKRKGTHLRERKIRKK